MTKCKTCGHDSPPKFDIFAPENQDAIRAILVRALNEFDGITISEYTQEGPVDHLGETILYKPVRIGHVRCDIAYITHRFLFTGGAKIEIVSRQELWRKG